MTKRRNLDDLLRQINNGKLRGAKRKLASELDVSDATVGRWISGIMSPTGDFIKKMAKIFNTTEEEIRDAFGSGNKNFLSNSNIIGNIDSNSGNIEMQSASDTRLALLQKDIEIIKKDIEIIKLQLSNYLK